MNHVRFRRRTFYHYTDVIMGAMVSQITSLTTVYSTVYPGADKKNQSSAPLAFARGIHRGPANSWRGKCFHLMSSSWHKDKGNLIIHLSLLRGKEIIFSGILQTSNRFHGLSALEIIVCDITALSQSTKQSWHVDNASVHVITMTSHEPHGVSKLRQSIVCSTV